jgi:hypothetical protein
VKLRKPSRAAALACKVSRDDLAGMLTERKEHGVLFIGHLNKYQVERLSPTTEKNP